MVTGVKPFNSVAHELEPVIGVLPNTLVMELSHQLFIGERGGMGEIVRASWIRIHTFSSCDVLFSMLCCRSERRYSN